MMNILIMDSDWPDRTNLQTFLEAVMPDANICAFKSSKEALEYAKSNPVYIAFIDLNGMHVPGYYLAKNILALRKCNVIFTNYEWEHLLDAIELRVSGYLRKPLRDEEVLTELQNLRYPFSNDDYLESDEIKLQEIPKSRGFQRFIYKFMKIVSSVFL